MAGKRLALAQPGFAKPDRSRRRIRPAQRQLPAPDPAHRPVGCPDRRARRSAAAASHPASAWRRRRAGCWGCSIRPAGTSPTWDPTTAPCSSPWQTASSKITARRCRQPAPLSWGACRWRAAPGTSCACGCAPSLCKFQRSKNPFPSNPRLCAWITRDSASWAYLRLANFTSRPGHADQLHLDLWWRGYNLAQDAGTYLYNAPPPWDNALSRTRVHNTLTVDGLDQMTLAGRFLWLDWAQASLVEQAGGNGVDPPRLTARHDGYRRLGVTHQRSVACLPEGRWLVEDSLLPEPGAKGPGAPLPVHRARLHWLLPDWPWQLDTGATRRRSRSHRLPVRWSCASAGNARLRAACSPGARRGAALRLGRGGSQPGLGIAYLCATISGAIAGGRAARAAASHLPQRMEAAVSRPSPRKIPGREASPLAEASPCTSC